ncbi:unnamed protein product [Aphanomyces euteiches]
MFGPILDVVRVEELKPRSKWVPNMARSTCSMCNERFSLFRHKHHCRTCGEVVCMDCYTTKTAVSPTAEPSRVIVCVFCLAKRERQFLLHQAAGTPPHTIDFANPFQYVGDETDVFDPMQYSKSSSKKRSSFMSSISKRYLAFW